jgi:endonuclease/exonuclease/phosphatase family metal-dependent hydrolase
MLVACATITVGCAAPGPHREVVTRIVSWNVQNLFDGSDDGGEYCEYRAEAGWDRGDYWGRLEKIDAVVHGLSEVRRLPDLLVFQEMESPAIGADLARDFFRRHRYVCSGEPGNTTTQVVVLSRRRPDVINAHCVTDVALTPDGAVRRGRRSRDTVELRFESRGLRVFAAHWKSQSGGEAATEPRRIREAALVYDTIAWRRSERSSADAHDCERRCADAVSRTFEAVLLVGDLNEDLDEYRSHGRAWPTALMPLEEVRQAVERHGARPAGIRFVPAGAGPRAAGERHPATDAVAERARAHDDVAGLAADGIVFRTLWTAEREAVMPGTYAYRGEWERLDHCFLAAPAEYSGEVRIGVWERLLDDDGTPMRFQARTGRGYSDHLPILVTITRRRAPSAGGSPCPPSPCSPPDSPGSGAARSR